MLRILLDEHVSPAVSVALTTACPELAVVAAPDWRGGEMLSADEETLLEAAAADGLTLLTFDLRTIPLLLSEWTGQGRVHRGVIFVHSRTLPAHDVGGLVRAVAALWTRFGNSAWSDHVVFLRPEAAPRPR